jgi:Eukaryotic phosphomannomutase
MHLRLAAALSSTLLSRCVKAFSTMAALKAVPKNPRVIALFDVDGTLTEARKVVTPEMRTFMETLSKEISIGVVGGSDLVKQQEQLGEDGTVHVCCVILVIVSCFAIRQR